MLTDALKMPTYPDLRGKVVVVTGGSKGIGAATCRLFARQGASVAVNGRDQADIETVVGEITEMGGQAMAAIADCRDFAAIEHIRTELELRFGPADILATFAGGFSAYKLVHEITEEEWHSVMDANATTTFLAIKSFLPGMIERRRGSIVTMASNAARFLDILTTAPYAASKAAVISLTRHVAKEVGQYGVRINCVAPATVLSDRVRNLMPESRRAEVAAMSPLGRMGEPDDVALATLFLSSESYNWLTGVTLDVAGGRIML